MTTTDTDRFTKEIELKAPLGRVWQALTDSAQFGEWFGVELDGGFVAGKTTTGRLTIEGYEHVPFAAVVTAVEPRHYFAYEWHPYNVEKDIDYSEEPRTLVEFRLKATERGTTVQVTESGFDRLPAARRAVAFEKNGNGWATQLESIAEYVHKDG